MAVRLTAFLAVGVAVCLALPTTVRDYEKYGAGDQDWNPSLGFSGGSRHEPAYYMR